MLFSVFGIFEAVATCGFFIIVLVTKKFVNFSKYIFFFFAKKGFKKNLI